MEKIEAWSFPLLKTEYHAFLAFSCFYSLYNPVRVLWWSVVFLPPVLLYSLVNSLCLVPEEVGLREWYGVHVNNCGCVHFYL